MNVSVDMDGNGLDAAGRLGLSVGKISLNEVLVLKSGPFLSEKSKEDREAAKGELSFVEDAVLV